MSRQLSLRLPNICMLGAVLLVSVRCSQALLAAPERPNVIFFITDDISPDDLEVYGNETVKTPNLMRLAAGGLVFDNAYLTTSSCSPSRCSIITGRYPHNTGAPELHTTLPKDQVTFVETLREAGYHTVISGKNHMAPPVQLGFDEHSDSKPSGAENWTRHLRECPQDRPFFCWFASHDAHHPHTLNDEAPQFDPKSFDVPPMLFDGPGTRQELAEYFHEVARTDHYVGELLRTLDELGRTQNTYIIYCSDNGRPFPRCKTYLYDSGIRTPLIIAGPGVAHGRSDSLISSIDVAATLLELAGVEKPASVQGVSFAEVFADPNATTRDVAFAERNWHVFQNHERAVRSGDWLYIWNAYPERHNVSGESAWLRFPAAKELWIAADAGQLTPAQALLTKVPQPAELLFNVKQDPNQFVNLARDEKHHEVLDRMRKLLARWQDDTSDSVPVSPTPDRGPLHERGERDTVRGDFPGAARGATAINSPGPVRIDD